MPVREYALYGELCAESLHSSAFILPHSPYGFTGEWTDATGLVYLRARDYSPWQGRFLSRDPSGLEANLYLYASANPVNRLDRTGLMSGLEAFAVCLAIHTGSQFGLGASGLLNGVSAQDAVDICQLAYSKDAWSGMPFGQYLTSTHNLFGFYLHESSLTSRFVFTASYGLTKELASSYAVKRLRGEYLQFGETESPRESLFTIPEQIACFSDYRPWLSPSQFLSLPLTCFLGSFYYQMKEVGIGAKTYVGFRIDNRTDLESGTHIALRFPGEAFEGSVEELITSGQITGRESVLSVLNTPYGGKRVVSILRARTQTETGWYTSSLGTHELGGGNLIQTYVWMEEVDPCDPFSRFGFYLGWHAVEEWNNWLPPVTQPILRWQETY